jgi:pSer/pThr/pTyr-binding forkhead associated (FHA) protein
MLSKELGKFTIVLPTSVEPQTRYKEGILVGRLDTCDIILDHATVSRIHAGINFRDDKYNLVNLSSSNTLTLNGRLLNAQKSDVLAGGDTIQIGPFTIAVGIADDLISLTVQQQIIDTPIIGKPTEERLGGGVVEQQPDVLKVFWEKRSREKEDWGTRLRPTTKPIPGKAMFNWRPTRDLKRPWRTGLFLWAFLLIGAVGAFAYFRYPQTYAPMPLANPHASKIDGSLIATASNGNSCTTCHMANEPVENACIKCHQAEQFHASNTKAHEDAGVTCTACHREHQGSDFDMKGSAIQSCSQCHNDANTTVYNGRSVRTAHRGSYGYPAVNGKWAWRGVTREAADAIPELTLSATGDADDQQRLSRQFHTIHVGRLKAPEGLKGDSQGYVSCSTCHEFFQPTVDRSKPQQTCAACHTSKAGNDGRDKRFAGSSVNCISCHVQHPYSGNRWSEFMTEDALKRRKDAVAAKLTKVRAE